nr:hypothetical protein [Angustibacter aerolatus]
MFYRKDLLKKNSIAVPTTMAEYVAAGEKPEEGRRQGLQRHLVARAGLAQRPAVHLGRGRRPGHPAERQVGRLAVDAAVGRGPEGCSRSWRTRPVPRRTATRPTRRCRTAPARSACCRRPAG